MEFTDIHLVAYIIDKQQVLQLTILIKAKDSKDSMYIIPIQLNTRICVKEHLQKVPKHI